MRGRGVEKGGDTHFVRINSDDLLGGRRWSLRVCGWFIFTRGVWEGEYGCMDMVGYITRASSLC